MENQKSMEITEPPFKRISGTIANLLVPTDDDPIAVYYFRSNWQYGYPMYHVIIEYGDMEQTEYQHMSEEEMCKRFKVTPEILNENLDVKVNQENIKEFPNDQDLGRSIRKQFII